MNAIKIIDGEKFTDQRGCISSMNTFSFDGIKRYYFIQNRDTSIIRGWHGHQFEKKWFQCIKGSFTIALVKIDDWDHPSKDLNPSIYKISAYKPQIICVPEGYANCIKANETDSILLVYSGNTYPECLDDSWRYDPNYWFDWSKIR